MRVERERNGKDESEEKKGVLYRFDFRWHVEYEYKSWLLSHSIEWLEQDDKMQDQKWLKVTKSNLKYQANQWTSEWKIHQQDGGKQENIKVNKLTEWEDRNWTNEWTSGEIALGDLRERERESCGLEDAQKDGRGKRLQK